MRQLDLASRYFSEYLQQSKHLKYFDEALNYQFQIAEAFRHGVKKSLFGVQKMPKIVSAYEDAAKLYDEVIKTMPHHELAAQSLYAKGEVSLLIEEYRDSIESLQMLIQRFPKHELALDSYVLIAKVYLAQCNENHQDISLLDLAQINLNRFEKDFPKEQQKVQEVKDIIGQMNEIFAKSFMEVAKYYDRVKKYSASKIYYSKIIRTFPTTKAAQYALARLEKLQAKEEKNQ
jgi:outer membrane assembly lipoprotein YfiO